MSTESTSPKRHVQTLPVNLEAERELHRYLDTIAECFKTSRFGLAYADRWEKVCITALNDGMEIGKLTTALMGLIARNVGKEHFTTPEAVLKEAQMANVAPPKPSYYVNPETGKRLK